MLLVVLNILVWILIVILFVILGLFVLWAITGYKNKVPFVPVPNIILKDIYELLKLKESSVVYDLGCGDGRVLFYIAHFIPKATYRGIENSPFPLILARARAWWYSKFSKTKIEIVNQDFFTRDLSDATHIFTYLYPNVMDDLLPKFEKELKSGTRLISVAFRFTHKQPIGEYDLERNKYKLARKIYVYEF